MTSQSLILYRPSSSSLTSPQSSSSPNLFRFFTPETGTHIATELLYRILVAICQRVFNSFEEFATRRLDQFANYLERAKEARKESKVMKELAVQEREMGKETWACPLTGKGGEKEPPVWMKKRMEEGRGPPFMGPPRWVQLAQRNFRKAEENGSIFGGNEHAELFE